MKRLLQLLVLSIVITACGGGGGSGSGSSTPVTMSLSASAVSSTAIHLNWTPATVAPSYYAVYMNGTKLGNVYSATSVTPGNLEPDTRYCFQIGAVYFPFGVLEQSNQACASTPVDLPPAAPSGLNANVTSPAQVDLDWNASTDDYGVARYFVYRDGARIAQVDNTMASDASLDPAKQYCYQVSAYDTSANESAKSVQVCVTTPDDVTSPTIPQNLSAVAVNDTEIKVSWSASTDDGVVRGYRLSRNGILIVDTANTDYSDVGVSPTSQYCYEVVAYDAGGNQSGVSATSCVSTGWTLITIDGQGSVLAPDAALALDQSGNVHIGYYDGTFIASNQQVDDLKYATNVSGFWAVKLIDGNASAQQDVGIAMGPGDSVHISYSSVYSANLKYATTSSGSWTTEDIDSTVNTGSYSSIATDSLGRAHVAYGLGELRYVTNNSGTWQSEIVDNNGTVGYFSNIAIDSSDKVHISYFEWHNGDLRYATNVSGQWVVDTIDSMGQLGYGTSIAVDSSDKVHICYHDRSNGDLKYATNTSGLWKIQVVDNAGDVGRGCSVALDGSGNVHISYVDETNHDLRYATNASGTWHGLTIDNAWVDGETSLGVDVSGKAHISYYGKPSLKYATNR
jgi:hypothetical protein